MKFRLRPWLLGLLGVLAAGGSAEATWSIAAVDRATGQVGIAGASCTYNVQGIGEVVPGQGLVVVQAMSNGYARAQGMKLLREGAGPEQIIQAMREERFDPENQQYGVVVLAGEQPPGIYSGSAISGWHGARTADGVLAMGNTLVGRQVVDAAFETFAAGGKKSLAERLTAALVAGADAGGDNRCGEQHARSAFVLVFNSDDHPRTPYLDLVVYGIDEGGPSAVAILEREFARWRKRGTKQTSTRQYVIP